MSVPLPPPIRDAVRFDVHGKTYDDLLALAVTRLEAFSTETHGYTFDIDTEPMVVLTGGDVGLWRGTVRAKVWRRIREGSAS